MNNTTALRYTLVDGVEKNREHPETFRIPAQAEKDNIQPGFWIKLSIVIDPPYKGILASERPWVKVVSRDSDIFRGTIDNELVLTEHHGLSLGDPIEFEARHVLAILQLQGETT